MPVFHSLAGEFDYDVTRQKSEILFGEPAHGIYVHNKCLEIM